MIIRNQFGRAAQAVTEPTHTDAVLEGFGEALLKSEPATLPSYPVIELTPTEKRIANLAKARAAKAAKNAAL